MPITRPRISGAEASCTLEFAAVEKVMLARPTGTSINARRKKVGIRPAAISNSPKTRAPKITSRVVGCALRAPKKGTDEGPGGKQRGQEPEGGRAAVEHDLVDESERDLEVEPERPD